MKNLKMFQAAIAVTVLSVLTGCSDQISSSGEPYQQSVYNGGAAESHFQIERPTFSTKLLLLSKEVHTFNFENTGLSSFYSIDVQTINSSDKDTKNCNDILVFNDEKSSKSMLNCNSSNLDLKSISIVNTGTSPVKLHVLLSGRKAVIDQSLEDN